MNEIRQLCTNSSSPTKHLDEILALFQACPPHHLLPSLSLIGQSISCMSIDQFNHHIVHHPIFLLIRQWSERLLQIWLNNSTLNSEEYRAIFYIHQLFKLLSEWLCEQENRLEEQYIEEIMKDLFADENFLQTLSRVIQQLIYQDQPDLDEDDHLSLENIQLHTHTSDTQAEQADVLDVLYRCVNSLVILYSHPSLVKNSIVEETLTPGILECLNSPLFTQFSLKFLHQNVTSEMINIRSRFFLFTCLDYSTLSTMSRSLLPSISDIFHIWCEMPKKPDEEISLLIVRLIRFLNQFAFENREVIIRENICAFLLPHFDLLCQTSSVIDDLTSLIIHLSSIPIGKEHLRQLGFVQSLLHEVKHHVQLWHPLGLLMTVQDLAQTSFLKRLIHLLALRTTNICQSLTSALNDTSFDSISLSSKSQLAITAIEWFVLLRTHFLVFSIIVDELINSTKKIHLINMFLDTILSLEQNEEILPKLIEVMMKLLWTCTFSTTTNIHEILQKHSQLGQWLKGNITDSLPNIRLASQAILSILDPSRSSTLYRRSSFTSNILICMLNADESYHDLCLTLRDRLQIEQQYSVELIVTPKCQSIDSLIHLINRSSLCLFCSSTLMKTDNLAHFIYSYLAVQCPPIPLLTILLEQELEFDGNWLEHIPMIDNQSILKEIRRYLNSATSLPRSTHHQPYPTNSIRISQNFMQHSICYWSTDDVNQWCEATQGHFESLRPLVMRLNGPALIQLAEILAMEPASMYHSLNDELLQRTGSTVPLTEYVSLCSELQRLVLDKQPIQSTTLPSKKKKWKNSRFCTLF